jgi:hypothetical protein
MLDLVALVRTDDSEEHSAFIIRVTRIGKLGTTLAISSNRRTLRCIPVRYQFLEEPHGLTSHKTAFFIVTAVKTSNLTTMVSNLETRRHSHKDYTEILQAYFFCLRNECGLQVNEDNIFAILLKLRFFLSVLHLGVPREAAEDVGEL